MVWDSDTLAVLARITPTFIGSPPPTVDGTTTLSGNISLRPIPDADELLAAGARLPKQLFSVPVRRDLLRFQLLFLFLLLVLVLLLLLVLVVVVLLVVLVLLLMVLLLLLRYAAPSRGRRRLPTQRVRASRPVRGCVSRESSCAFGLSRSHAIRCWPRPPRTCLCCSLYPSSPDQEKPTAWGDQASGHSRAAAPLTRAPRR